MRIKELGWQDDPFDGLKIMRMQVFLMQIPLQKQCSELILSRKIGDAWRHQTIKNTIEWRSLWREHNVISKPLFNEYLNEEECNIMEGCASRIDWTDEGSGKRIPILMHQKKDQQER